MLLITLLHTSALLTMPVEFLLAVFLFLRVAANFKDATDAHVIHWSTRLSWRLHRRHGVNKRPSLSYNLQEKKQ